MLNSIPPRLGFMWYELFLKRKRKLLKWDDDHCLKYHFPSIKGYTWKLFIIAKKSGPPRDVSHQND